MRLAQAAATGWEIREIAPSETWDLRHRVLWPDKDLAFVQLPEDDAGIHWGLIDAGKVVVVISLFPGEGKELQFRKFATEPHRQGQGLGTALLSQVMEWAESQGMERIWCNARADKTAFYRRFDMQETDSAFSKSGVDYVIMEKIRK